MSSLGYSLFRCFIKLRFEVMLNEKCRIENWCKTFTKRWVFNSPYRYKNHNPPFCRCYAESLSSTINKTLTSIQAASFYFTQLHNSNLVYTSHLPTNCHREFFVLYSDILNSKIRVLTISVFHNLDGTVSPSSYLQLSSAGRWWLFWY